MPVILGVLLIIYWRSRKTYRGFGCWVLANFSIGVGYILFVLRDQVPDFYSVLLGNTLMVLGLVLMYTGLQLFFDRRPSLVGNGVVLSAYLLALLVLTYAVPNINARIVLISTVSLWINMNIGVTLIRHAPVKLRHACLPLALLFFLSALFSIVRVVYVFGFPQPKDLLADGMFMVLTIGALSIITVWTFYLFILNGARLELHLLETQETLLDVAEMGRHKVIQLGLLDETSRSLAESSDEMEIMRRTVRAIVSRFGYAEAAISLLAADDSLEVVVIDGTEDIGYRPGFRQKIGEGIIGRTAEKRSVYVCSDIEQDPYYFSIGARSGSAVCVPMQDEGQLLGVLYVESVKRDAFSPDEIQTLDTLTRHAVTAVQKARLFARAQAHLRAISTLQSVAQTILSSLELRQVFQSVVQMLKEAYRYTHVSIYTLHGQVLRLEAQAGYPDEMALQEIPAAAGITGRSVQTRQTQFVRDVNRDADFLRAASDVVSEICVPIIRDDQVLGVLNVESGPGRELNEDDLLVLNALVGPVVVAIENAHLHAEVKQLALTDGLTQLYNRRAFDEMLAGELSRAARYAYPLSVAIIDMDNFKEFNDRYGHLAGDDRLRETAELLRSNLRVGDIVARFGGEEFALILPCTSKENANELAERMRAAAWMAAPVRGDRRAPIAGYTFSIGLATFPDDGRAARELLFAADQAELAAKKMGKNCVCAAGETLELAVR